MYSLGEKAIIYPYISLDWNQYTMKAHNNIKDNDDRVGSGALGVTYAQEFREKFLLTASGEWNYNRGRDHPNAVHLLNRKRKERSEYVSIYRRNTDRNSSRKRSLRCAPDCGPAAKMPD